MGFVLKKLLVQFIVPPLNLLLLALAGLLLMKRWPKFGRALAGTSLLVLLLLATPAVSHLLIQSVRIGNPFDADASKSAQAIVILGGGLRRGTPEYGDTLSLYTLDRVRYGATLAKKTNIPILVTGGVVFEPPPEAPAMAHALEVDFGVRARWIEDLSRDTEDNLKFSAKLLNQEHIDTVILVTHDFHMRRALAHCARAALTCIPAPVSLKGLDAAASWVEHLPNASALQTSALAIHEIFGNLAVALQGD